MSDEATLTCNVALSFWMRMLWPCPSILPAADTRHAPIGTPPSSLPFCASDRAALNPASVAAMVKVCRFMKVERFSDDEVYLGVANGDRWSCGSPLVGTLASTLL
jgi:hypothetical protein